jgi:hypothetical protein
MKGGATGRSFTMGRKDHGDLREDLVWDRHDHGGGPGLGLFQTEDVIGHPLDEERVGGRIGPPTTIDQRVHGLGLGQGVAQSQTGPTRSDEKEVFGHFLQPTS